MAIKNFYDLECWKKSADLCCQIYRVTEKFPKSELFGITSQLRRASSSIMANIAEGHGRFHYKDKNRFYYQARGSISEVQSFLLLAHKLGFVSKEECLALFRLSKKIQQILNGLIRSQDKIA